MNVEKYACRNALRRKKPAACCQVCKSSCRLAKQAQAGPAQQLAADEAAGEMMGDTSDPQT